MSIVPKRANENDTFRSLFWDFSIINSYYLVFIFVFFNWVFQISSVATAGIVAGSLAASGFDATLAVTAEQLVVIKNLATLYPGLINLVGVICFSLYPLNDKRMATIRSELEIKRSEAGNK